MLFIRDSNAYRVDVYKCYCISSDDTLPPFYYFTKKKVSVSGFVQMWHQQTNRLQQNAVFFKHVERLRTLAGRGTVRHACPTLQGISICAAAVYLKQEDIEGTKSAKCKNEYFLRNI